MKVPGGMIERTRARRAVGVLLLFVCFAAAAHDLSVFATVEDGVLHGYAFFGGGARARTAQLIIRDGAGNEMFRGGTDAHGAFYFRPTSPTDLIVTVDVGDGHAAKTRIPASRFAASRTMSGIVAGESTEGARTVAPDASAASTELPGMIDRSVDRAVARQITPLLEAYAIAGTRLRLNDILSAVALIIGLAGMFLWARSRPRRGSGARDAP